MGTFNGKYITNTANNKSIPLSLLKDGGEGYHAIVHIISDEDAYTDGENVTHRNPMKYTKAKVYLNTIDELTEAQKLQIQEVLNNPLLMNLTWWNDYTHDFQTDNFYMTEIEWKHKHVDKTTYAITYAGVSITLIAYKTEES